MEHITINSDRSVTVPVELRKIGVQYDHNVNTIEFVGPRYSGNVDLSTMTIYINYILSDKTPGKYKAENVIIDDQDDSLIRFNWTITRNVTKVYGILSCLVCAKKIDEEGNEINHWNTDIFRLLSVSEGMENDPVIQEQYPDVITSLIQNIEEHDTKLLEFSGLNIRVTDLENNIDELKDDIEQIKQSGGSGSGTGSGGESSTFSYTSWLAIGDSITVGYSNNNYSYADILAEKYGVYLVKDAITGTHISTDSEFGVSFANRYAENADDYNLITVVGGINDWGHGVELGEFNPETTGTDTFANGMNTLVRGLIEKYPNGKIVFFTSNINNNTIANGISNLKFEDYVDVMRTVCAYYSIPFYPLHLMCGFNGLATYDLNAGTMNTDKTHPLTAGHKKMADIIADCINFVNPVYSYGKGTLDITLKISTIPAGASTAEIKECLTVNVDYENGISYELSDYIVEGTIIEGQESTLTIKYRNMSETITINGGQASGEYNLLFQLAEPVSVDETTKVVDLGYAPFAEAAPRTIKMIFDVDNTFMGVSVLRAWDSKQNVNVYAGISINGIANANKRLELSYANSSFPLLKNLSTNEYLVFGSGSVEVFVVWDGATTITTYVCDSTDILWSTTKTGCTLKIGDYTMKLGYNHTSRYWTGTLSTFNVWGQAFTEQDVLKNI